MGSKRCKCWDCVGSRDRRQEVLHGGVTDEELPRKGPRKKTRKWCKGKQGVKHTWVREALYPWSPDTLVQVCQVCGKHGKYFWGSQWL